MNEVGTQVGTVHNLRQGEGLATVLQGDRAMDTAERLFAYDMAERQRKDQELARKRDAAMLKLRSINPEFFYKHNAEKQKEQDKLMAIGAELIDGGKDPFNGTDPRSVEFQKQYQRLMSMSQTSQQVKGYFDELQKKVLGSNPDDFDAESIYSATSVFDKPLADIMEKGFKPPVLQKKRAGLAVSEMITKNVAQWQQSRGGEPPTDTELEQFVNGIATDGGNLEKFVEGYGTKLAQLSKFDPDEAKRVSDSARASGREVWQQMAFEDAKRAQKRRERFDIAKDISEAARAATQALDEVSTSNSTGFWSGPRKGSPEEVAKWQADLRFNSDERYMTDLDREGVLPRGKEESDVEYGVRVKKYLYDRILPGVKTETKSGRTSQGEDEQKAQKSRLDFLADIRSGDTVRMQDAANILVGTKYSANMSIEDANVVAQGPGAYWLELEVTSPLSTDKIKEEFVQDGVSSEQVRIENRQGKKIVNIGLAPGAVENQTLVRLLDNYMKQTGATYDTKLTQRSAKTAFDAGKMPMSTIPAPARKTTVDESFFK